MKAVLVDPFRETVEDIDFDHEGSGFRAIYDVIECGDRGFDCVMVAQNMAMYVDDMGLFQPNQRFFEIKNYRHKLAGKALITGVDEEGDTIPCPIPADRIRPLITFLPSGFKYAGMRETEGEGHHPAFGKVHQITKTPLFVYNDPYSKKREDG